MSDSLAEDEKEGQNIPEILFKSNLKQPTCGRQEKIYLKSITILIVHFLLNNIYDLFQHELEQVPQYQNLLEDPEIGQDYMDWIYGDHTYVKKIDFQK